MTPAGRVAVALALGLGAVGVLPAAAEDLGFGWEGEITDPNLESGSDVRGDAFVLPVAFEYHGPPGSVIAEIAVELTPHERECGVPQRVVQRIADGDGAGAPTIDPTPDPVSPRPATAAWTFTLDPGCNGAYDVAVSATADPVGPAGPGDAGTRSGSLELRDVQLSLAPPSPSSLSAVVAGDRTVALRWTAPASWRDGPPADAVGYRVQRVGGDAAPVTIATVEPSRTSFVDGDGATIPAGRYRYQVVALRRGASGAPVASAPVQAEADLPAAAGGATTTAAGPPPSAAPFVPAARTSPQPAVPVPAPTVEFDPGFQPTLDYGDAEVGAADAVPPGDAAFVDVADDPIGAGILVPAAVAICVAVWAMHARHLVRRATPS